MKDGYPGAMAPLTAYPPPDALVAAEQRAGWCSEPPTRAPGALCEATGAGGFSGRCGC